MQGSSALDLSLRPLRERFFPTQRCKDRKETRRRTMDDRPKVVIIGGGFGGLWAAKALAKKPVEVTLIDRKNHHVFQPLLYQVATAVLSPGEIAQPIRRILHKYKNIEVILGEAAGFDKENNNL